MRIPYALLILVVVSCKEKESKTEYVWDSMVVTASAYNSTKAQTAGDPNITAWGDSLKPGLKYIAVSRDLIRKGLKYDTPVVIDGLEGLYLVKDKMHHKWKNKIDIYMGTDVKAARQWGRRKVCIDYRIKLKEPKK